MTRYRKALIAPLLLAAAVAQPSQAHAFSLTSGWFGWFFAPCRDGVCGIDFRP